MVAATAKYEAQMRMLDQENNRLQQSLILSERANRLKLVIELCNSKMLDDETPEDKKPDLEKQKTQAQADLEELLPQNRVAKCHCLVAELLR